MWADRPGSVFRHPEPTLRVIGHTDNAGERISIQVLKRYSVQLKNHESISPTSVVTAEFVNAP